LDMDFTVRSQNEAYKNSTKIIQKFTVGHDRTTPPPEYATVYQSCPDPCIAIVE